MAFNPKAIKALFGKLAPYADDVAKGVANYGDDAARLAANYGDDALRAVDKADDFLDDVTFLDDFAIPNSPRTAQQHLKDELLFKRSPASLDVRDIPKLPATVPDGHVWERWGNENVSRRLHTYDSPYWGGFPSTTEYLGDVFGDLGEGLMPTLSQNAIKIPELPTSQLVAQTPAHGSWDDLSVVGLRPHKNTALGRWFAKNMPSYPQHQLIDDYEIF